jgi:hypothetical protein
MVRLKSCDKFQFASPVGKTNEIHLRLMIKTTVVRINHKFTLNELPGGSIQSDASYMYLGENIIFNLKEAK